MRTATPIVRDVESWNNTFAQEHDIDDYYARSSFLIRWIERRRLACIREMVAPRLEDRILEVGCGGGHVLQLFPQCDLTGVDVSGWMLDKARHNLQGCRVRLLKGELHELDLPDGSFDTIVCSEVLEHAVEPERILADAQRLLRPGGKAVITFPNDTLIHRLKELVRSSGLTLLPPFRRISWGGDDYHLHVWSVKEMRKLLSSFFQIKREQFAPSRLMPIRCCFSCGPLRS